MTMTRTCLSQQNIIIKHKDGYESKNLFINYCELFSFFTIINK